MSWQKSAEVIVVGKKTDEGLNIQSQEYVQQGHSIVVDTDLEKFFDTVNHDILMSKLHEYVADKIILKLIRKYLKNGVMINGCCIVTGLT